MRLTPDEYRTVCERLAKASRKTCSVAPVTQQEPDSSHEPLAEETRTHLVSNKRLIRIKSYRLRLLDERNIWDAYVTDALVQAGILRDDSPAWAKIEVTQEQVSHKEQERTEIEVYEYERTQAH